MKREVRLKEVAIWMRVSGYLSLSTRQRQGGRERGPGQEGRQVTIVTV